MHCRGLRPRLTWFLWLPALVLLVLPAVAPAARAASGSTQVTVQVLQTLTLSSDSSAVSLDLDPSGGGAASASRAVVTVSVLTNSRSGYTLYVNDDARGLYSADQGYQIPRVQTAGADPHAEPSFGTPSFGVSADLAAGGEFGGAACRLLGDFATETWNPYSSTAQGLCARGGPTPSADVLKLTNQVGVDYQVPAGVYRDTIYYTATAGI